ncbi:MAG: hypothetical protein JO027_08585 [Solirubrobacterales bacterium]|nr:hypothetical protein [Solirubrobacterales bacterium]
MATAAIAAAGAAAAVAPGVYAGRSPRAVRHMDIELQVLPGDRRANWRVDVFGPCTEHLTMGRTVGTDAGNTPQDPRLRLSGGRFTLNWHAYASLHPLWYSYTLTGHAVAGGFTGTFHYRESDHHGYLCDSHLLHWSARRTSGSFP